MKQSKCACGVDLPDHLAEMADKSERIKSIYSHQCSCHRRWSREGGVWVDKGVKGAKNPFTS